MTQKCPTAAVAGANSVVSLIRFGCKFWQVFTGTRHHKFSTMKYSTIVTHTSNQTGHFVRTCLGWTLYGRWCRLPLQEQALLQISAKLHPAPHRCQTSNPHHYPIEKARRKSSCGSCMVLSTNTTRYLRWLLLWKTQILWRKTPISHTTKRCCTICNCPIILNYTSPQVSWGLERPRDKNTKPVSRWLLKCSVPSTKRT